MVMVDAQALAQMRAEAALLMPDTAVIVRPTTVSDGQGGVTETGTTIIATVACRVMPVGQAGSGRMERQIADRIGSDFQWLITLPHGTAVQVKDRLTINGRTFEAALGMTPHSWDTAVRIAATEIL